MKLVTNMISLFLLPMTLISTMAFAADSKLYSGTLCQSISNSTSVIHQDGVVYNKSTSIQSVDCGVARDAASSSAITVYAIDQNYGDNVRCYASSIKQGTAFVGWWSTTGSSSGTNSAPQTLSLRTVTGDSTSYLDITCQIPAQYSGANSAVLSYRVNEN